ncbi:MAG: DNA-3-methyladenine glycosylase [Christensenellales bacterium]
MKKIVDEKFFKTDTISLAKNLLGKWLCADIDGKTIMSQITETEAYLGINDSACHTYKAKRTKRTEPMWQAGGTIYVYMCYGMHYLFNIVSREIDEPEAVLIRAVADANGPAKVTKYFGIDKNLNGQKIIDNKKISLFDDGKTYKYTTSKRVGINYALQKDRDALLRFILDKK